MAAEQVTSKGNGVVMENGQVYKYLWNSTADEFNQWEQLDSDEKKRFIYFINRAIEDYEFDEWNKQ